LNGKTTAERFSDKLSFQKRHTSEVKMTQSAEDPTPILYSEFDRGALFPLDRLWIARTNRLADEINHKVQEWRNGTELHQNVPRALTQFIAPVKISAGFGECHQIGFIDKIESLHVLLTS
jgi:hypothetical protein